MKTVGMIFLVLVLSLVSTLHFWMGVEIPHLSPILEKFFESDIEEEGQDVIDPQRHPSTKRMDAYLKNLHRLPVTKDGRFFAAYAADDFAALGRAVKLLDPTGQKKLLASAEKAGLAKNGEITTFPIFFEVSAQMVEAWVGQDGGVIPATAVIIIGPAFPREKVNSLPSTEPMLYSVGTADGIETTFQNTVDIVVSMVDNGTTENGHLNKEVYDLFEAKIRDDLGLGTKSLPRLYTVVVEWKYRGNTEHHHKTYRVVPFKIEEQIGLNDPVARDNFLSAAVTLDAARFDSEVKKFLFKNPGAREMRVVFWPSRDHLDVSRVLKVKSVSIKLDSMGIYTEFDRRGIFETPQEFEFEVMDHLGLYETKLDGKGGVSRAYKSIKPSMEVIKKFCYLKPGMVGDEYIVYYYHPIQDLPAGGYVLNSQTGVADLAVTVTGGGKLKKKSHYYFGTVQTPEEIVKIFQEYKTGQGQGGVFPCKAVFNHMSNRVEYFKFVGKKEEIAGKNPSVDEEEEKDGGDSPVFKVTNLGQIDKIRDQLADLGIALPSKESFKKSLQAKIKRDNLRVALRGDVIVGGCLEIAVAEGKYSVNIAQDPKS